MSFFTASCNIFTVTRPDSMQLVTDSLLLVPDSLTPIQTLIDTELVGHLADPDDGGAGSQALPEAAWAGGGRVRVILSSLVLGIVFTGIIIIKHIDIIHFPTIVIHIIFIIVVIKMH